MAKPGEHTYALITCARTKPPPLSPSLSLSLFVLHCCALCLQFQLWLFPLSPSVCLCLVNMTFGVLTFLLTLASTGTADCALPSDLCPCVCQLAFPVAVVLLQPESWLRMSAVPCWGPFPASAVSACARVCVVGHVAILRIRRAVLIEHEHTHAQHK